MSEPDWGADAPGVRRGLLAAGLGGLGLTALAWRVWPGGAWALPLLIAALMPLMLGLAMVAYGIAGKRRMRDHMLALVPWTGAERVLDIGTGAGMLLAGAAARLTTGRATGVDIWSAKDLSRNTRQATQHNLTLCGVADRADIRTADACDLPLPDGSVDVALSLLCLHNIEGAAGQAQACREVARVLAPGGVALLADYVPTHGYARVLREAGLVIESSAPRFGVALSLMWLVIARRPASP